MAANLLTLRRPNVTGNVTTNVTSNVTCATVTLQVAFGISEVSC